MVQTTFKVPPKTGGDDLDDGLELDPDFLAASDEEGGSEVEGEDGISERGDGELPPLEGEEDEIVRSPIAESKKRLIEEVEADDGEDDEEAKKADKKKRKKEKEKERKAKKRQHQSGIPTEKSLTHLTPSELSSILLNSIRESYPSASSVELDDITIPESNLLPPPDYTPSISETDPFKPLQQRIESLLKPLEKKKLVVGQPQVIILALSGLRCADVVRGVRDVKGNGEVAKLFAKHFKLADQIKYLQNKKVSIAVGTPARVGKLLVEGAIKITSDTVLLLDVGHQDSKTRTILNLPEVRDELWKSVFSGKSRETLLGGGIRIGAF
ncbi:protein CMS1 [Kwoniella mangroviensis CBS 10435]|uniref:Protein CMS1 n=1 Tax=Kwoniella mangroviensis CBS 10435 TaxID=1331196 RepID=A0A1B9ILY8_9TREE|nr:protein CMS1 [Kwoniella mangroviensis CBS 10435]